MPEKNIITKTDLRSEMHNLVERALPDVELAVLNQHAQENKELKIQVAENEATISKIRQESVDLGNDLEIVTQKLNGFHAREKDIQKRESTLELAEGKLSKREMELDHKDAIHEMKCECLRSLAQLSQENFKAVCKPATVRRTIHAQIPVQKDIIENQPIPGTQDSSGSIGYGQKKVGETTEIMNTNKTIEDEDS